MIGAHSTRLGVLTGYVEVSCGELIWIPVCAAGWDRREAMVVCQQVGFSEGERVNHA